MSGLKSAHPAGRRPQGPRGARSSTTRGPRSCPWSRRRSEVEPELPRRGGEAAEGASAAAEDGGEGEDRPRASRPVLSSSQPGGDGSGACEDGGPWIVLGLATRRRVRQQPHNRRGHGGRPAGRAGRAKLKRTATGPRWPRSARRHPVVLARPTSYVNESGGRRRCWPAGTSAGGADRRRPRRDRPGLRQAPGAPGRGTAATTASGRRQGLGSPDFLRVRIGVGRPPAQGPGRLRARADRQARRRGLRRPIAPPPTPPWTWSDAP